MVFYQCSIRTCCVCVCVCVCVIKILGFQDKIVRENVVILPHMKSLQKMMSNTLGKNTHIWCSRTCVRAFVLVRFETLMFRVIF